MNRAAGQDRWKLTKEGIEWEVHADARLPHEDTVEMSGLRVSAIIRYGVNESGELAIHRKVVWPMLRTIPNDTHASLIHDYPAAAMPRFQVNGSPVDELPQRIAFDGILTIDSRTAEGISIRRKLFPAAEAPALQETIVLSNETNTSVVIEVDSPAYSARGRGIYGIYAMESLCDPVGPITLMPGESREIGVSFAGRIWSQRHWPLVPLAEEARRRERMHALQDRLQLVTPDPVLNRMFAFAKLRAAESVFRTKSGLLHGPGGGNFYAAVWTNDQIEYAAPFFPFLGDETAIEATINAFRLYMPFMGPDYTPIPSSIIAEGYDIWEGAGDRGDAAMYAYGASLFALAGGKRDLAAELWPAIVWCLHYCLSKLTPEGVIASDSDELEGRFPTGDANLSTSSLAYGGFRYAAMLAEALEKPEEANLFAEAAQRLRTAIEAYFGAEVEGFETYRYYDGNDILRSWICLPLTMGIAERQDGTVAALVSPRLWTVDGLSTQAGDTVFWDRSTLYGLRALFMAGETERGLDLLTAYSRRRLLGEHVPYAVEAYPEGNQRHLSAESALYGRVITEGLFGLSPTGLASYSCTPRLPAGWPVMSLRNAHAFGHCFDLEVRRGSGTEISVIVRDSGREAVHSGQDGDTFNIGFDEKAR
ncbi:hypothetical protein GXP70_21370 [Paenibacillus lycopersici]|uniref:Six-hairpin glycosidase-like protein n=1 Tax=Paenibacillus lycopersici TaxID=2704462 RepID=A0A6C0FYS9_9BACL|nr:hypothetical protein [Paenibacillus lycopersici]QHT62278.1 hypothetical protein GXP70_21370 [Paenibacillus lycopersici]